MKIALCTEILYPIYGVEKRVYEMAKRLPKYGFDVTVYTSSSPKELPDIAIKHVSHTTITRPPKRNYIYCMEYMLNLYKELLKDDYDIIDANGHLALMPCSLAAMSRRKPVVATIHDLYLNQWLRMYNGFGAVFGLPFELLFCKMPYDKVLTLNSSLKRRMINMMGMEKKKIEVVPSGIDVSYIDKVRCGRKGKNTVLYVGRLVPQKGVDVLLRAFSRIVDAELRIVGSGSELPKLKGLAEALGIANRVEFLGSLKNHDSVIREMKKATAVILPSVRECFGIVPLEAMCCRTAVISTETEGPRDYIKDGENGSLVGINNINELSVKIKNVLHDKKIRKTFEKNGRKTAELYDWDKIVKRMAEVYEAVVN